MTTHNQAGSDCYYCCGKCRYQSDHFKGDSLSPKWSDSFFGTAGWALDSENLYAAADVLRASDLDVSNASTAIPNWYSKVLHFDIQCATNSGTFAIGNYGFQFGTGSELIVTESGAYKWHRSMSLSTSTWYRFKFTISAITVNFYQVTFSLDGVDQFTFRNASFASFTPRFQNRRTFTRTAGNVVDTYTPGGSTTGALGQTRIRRLCINMLKLPSWLAGGDTIRRRYCDDPVTALDITNGLAATVELTISGAAESTLNDTFTLSHVAGVWQAGFLDTAYPFTYSGTDYCVRQLIAAFEYESVKYTVVIGRVGQPFTNFTIVFRDDTQPTALPFSRDYADMEYIHHTGGSTAMFNAIIGTGIDFAIAVP